MNRGKFISTMAALAGGQSLLAGGVLTPYQTPTQKKIVMLKARNLDDIWGDDRTMFYYNGELHICGVAVKAVTNGDVHLVYDIYGNRKQKFTVGYSARGGSSGSMITGKPVIVGGIGLTPNGNIDIWQYDISGGYSSAGWTQLNADFSGDIGNRVFPFCFDYGGYFYIGGGQQATTMYKTNNFTTWTLVATLPSALQNLAAAACCVFKGDVYIIGGVSGATPFGTTSLYNGTLVGDVWKYVVATNTFTKVVSAKDQFRCFWCNAIANDNFMYFVKGHVRDAQAGQFPGGFVTGDQLGVMRTADGVTWEELGDHVNNINVVPRRHTTANALVGQVPYFAAGAFCNDLFKII